MAKAGSAEQAVREIRRRTRRQFSAEEKIRIVLEGLRGEESIAALCLWEGLAPNLFYRWSEKFLEAGKKRLRGDTPRSRAPPRGNAPRCARRRGSGRPSRGRPTAPIARPGVAPGCSPRTG